MDNWKNDLYVQDWIDWTQESKDADMGIALQQLYWTSFEKKQEKQSHILFCSWLISATPVVRKDSQRNRDL